MLLYEATCNDIKLLKIYHSKTENKQGAKKVPKVNEHYNIIQTW